MSRTRGSLTRAQLEIMEVVWGRGAEGATAGEIWQELAGRRDVARTTIVTLVRRLERRGWLAGDREESPIRYRATRSRGHTTDRLAADFLDRFFGGSPEELVRSLLGSRRIDAGELARIRRLLDELEEEE